MSILGAREQSQTKFRLAKDFTWMKAWLTPLCADWTSLPSSISLSPPHQLPSHTSHHLVWLDVAQRSHQYVCLRCHHVGEKWMRGELLQVRAVHRISGELSPILKLNHLVQEYGTGAVMGIPTRNRRDALMSERWGCRERGGVLFGDDESGVVEVVSPGEMQGM